MAVNPDWTLEFDRWVEPFLAALGNKKRRLCEPPPIRWTEIGPQ